MLKSLSSASRFPPTARLIVATCAPSTQNTKLLAVQSIRYRCGDPSSPAPTRTWLPSLARAYTASPAPPVLKMIHGELKSMSATNPTCWNRSARNVATNSIERPGPNEPTVPARAPSTTSCPPLTVALPPPDHGADCQSPGSVLPENSAPEAGARITSPSAVDDP